jgi:hypothetical protein
VTSGLRAQLPTPALTLALVGAGVLELAAATTARELPIASGAACRAAHALRLDRRARWRERLPALRASTAHPHIVPPATRLLGLRVDQYRAAPRSCSRAALDHYPADKWIRSRAPLKREGGC